MKIIKRIARRLLNKSEKKRRFRMLRKLKSYFLATGWFKSVNDGLPVDAEGKPLPWYTYSFITFISARIQPNMRVFEYGTGNSTLWWSECVASVVACEHDEPWFLSISEKVPDNVDYRYCELEYGGDYSKLILSFSSDFDCIIIDGRDRVNCAKNALAALKENGVIIWDNSEREQYQEGYDFLLENGFRRIDFWGLGPINSDQWCTSVFYREENCLGI
ncbi:FkbM family methyltransferase [Planctomycetota bacterium]